MGTATNESSRKAVYLIDEAVNSFAETDMCGKLSKTPENLQEYFLLLCLYAPVDGTYETRVMESQSTYVPLDRRIEL